jgi:hypothetical protein
MLTFGLDIRMLDWEATRLATFIFHGNSSLKHSFEVVLMPTGGG